MSGPDRTYKEVRSTPIPSTADQPKKQAVDQTPKSWSAGPLPEREVHLTDFGLSDLILIDAVLHRTLVWHGLSPNPGAIWPNNPSVSTTTQAAAGEDDTPVTTGRTTTSKLPPIHNSQPAPSANTALGN